uniref:Uncharacterized protein n=1 Tax=Tetraselmis sp. GSL018 TaxID=582737 RepID=A0A061QY83_9CHLO
MVVFSTVPQGVTACKYEPINCYGNRNFPSSLWSTVRYSSFCLTQICFTLFRGVMLLAVTANIWTPYAVPWSPHRLQAVLQADLQLRQGLEVVSLL